MINPTISIRNYYSPLKMMSARAPPSLPPEKGSFPLDHYGDCVEESKAYLKCLKKKNYDNNKCKHVSKKYLECRMEK